MSTTEPKLTPKQQEIYKLLEQGLKPAEVAKKLKISPTGVYGHIRNMRKAGVATPNERSATRRSSTPASSNGAASRDVDVPTLIRERISKTQSEVDRIEGEAEAIQTRVTKLREQREIAIGEIKQHEAALAVYS